MRITPAITLKQLADLISCPYEGSDSHLITGINEIHMVQPGDLTFVDVSKYYDKALNSKASTIIINQNVKAPSGKALIFSDNPFTDYNRITEHFQPSISLDTKSMPQLGAKVKIGAGVVTGDFVSIGDETQIGHHVSIGSHVTIGNRCVIHPNVVIRDYVDIGDEVCINSGTVIGSEAFYFKSRPDGKEKLLTKGKVVIENRVDIGANCTIDRGVSGETKIGSDTKLDNLIQVGHDTVIGKRCIIASQVGIAGVCRIEDDVVLWGQVGIAKGNTIGSKAVLYGKTGVMTSLEGGKTYLGMIASPYLQKLREIAALKELPALLRKLKSGNL